MNPSNPAELSPGANSAISAGTPDAVKVAAGQKIILFAMLILLADVLFEIFLSARFAMPMIGSLLINGAIVVLSIYGVVRVGAALGFHVVVIVLCALLMVIPLLNFLVLGLVNARATKFLRAAGYKVGLMGAST